MKLPAKGTSARKIIALLHKRDSATLDELRDLFPNIKGCTIKAVATSHDLCTPERGVYKLPAALRKFLDGCEIDPLKPQAEIVPPRVINNFGGEWSGRLSSTGARVGSL